jgi:glycosyltransferase involved in cell wall biosynthesis
VIAYRRGSVPEIVDDGITGYIVDSMEAAALAVRRIETLDRRIVRRIFEQRFGAQRMCQSYVDIYRRISGGEPDLTAGELLSSAA